MIQPKNPPAIVNKMTRITTSTSFEAIFDESSMACSTGFSTDSSIGAAGVSWDFFRYCWIL